MVASWSIVRGGVGRDAIVNRASREIATKNDTRDFRPEKFGSGSRGHGEAISRGVLYLREWWSVV